MRKIKLSSIITAYSILFLLFAVVFLFSYGVHHLIPPNEYRATSVMVLAAFFYFWFSLITYRICATIFFPFPSGEIVEDSRDEFNYHVVTCIQLVVWSPWSRAIPWPVPLSRIIYKILGAKIGKNSYSGGIILDPFFVKIGKNCLLGHHSLICPHALEGAKVSHEYIEIGDNVTIGAFSIILPGCKIGDGAIIGMNSVLSKSSVVGPKEVWVGIPAKLIKKV